jgi:hypothetical protein
MRVVTDNATGRVVDVSYAGGFRSGGEQSSSGAASITPTPKRLEQTESGLTSPKRPGRIISERQIGGATVIRSIVGDPPGRRGYEDILLPGVDMNLTRWERSHSQGNITGAESARGIRYAPRAVNQELQKHGVERYISEFNQLKANDVTIYLTTETHAHPGTLRLSSIKYRVEAQRGLGRPKLLFEAEITVSNDRVNPRIDVHADYYGSKEDYLRPKPLK